jgi:hypothetical protein
VSGIYPEIKYIIRICRVKINPEPVVPVRGLDNEVVLTFREGPGNAYEALDVTGTMTRLKYLSPRIQTATPGPGLPSAAPLTLTGSPGTTVNGETLPETNGFLRITVTALYDTRGSWQDIKLRGALAA